VNCNRELRRALAAACERERLTLWLAEKTLCADNAAMIGILAERKLKLRVEETSPDADILPNWALG
jgi:tRNA A37 threonylcarbamoyltransferase TsaD